MKLSSQATEYVHTTITIDGATPASSPPVDFAFLPTCATPDATTQWSPGEWVAGSARILIGPAGLPLAPATYSVWVRVVDDPEIPVLPAGILTIS